MQIRISTPLLTKNRSADNIKKEKREFSYSFLQIKRNTKISKNSSKIKGYR